MNNLLQFIWILLWPVLILIIYKTIKWLLNNYEHKLENED